MAYLAQTRDPELAREARAIAERFGLEYEERYTGYGDLATSLSNFVTAGPAPAAAGRVEHTLERRPWRP
jgi:hypothetical protein